MAGVLGIIGDISSLVQLVSFTKELFELYQECRKQAAFVPRTLRRLPTLQSSLDDDIEAIQDRARRGLIPDKVREKIDELAEDILKNEESVSVCLNHINDTAGALPRVFYRARATIRCYRATDKLKEAVDNIFQTVALLTLKQLDLLIKVNDDTNEKAADIKAVVTDNTVTLNENKVTLNDNTAVLTEIHQIIIARGCLDSTTSQKTFGLHLGTVFVIASNAFIGRDKELQQLHDWLSTSNGPQRVVSIVGMGGLGKTQLSLAYAQKHYADYLSVFWLRARDRDSLRRDMMSLYKTIFPGDTVAAVNSDEGNRQIEKVQSWLSESWNTEWLIIFDNYDDSDVPDIHSSTTYDIRSFFPHCVQGSILITTRCSKLGFGKVLQLGKIVDVEDSIAVLSQRSGRDLSSDIDARRLADRLDGLPFALAIAGTYLQHAAVDCAEYLKLYELHWSELYKDGSETLMEYDGETLKTTWIISYRKVCDQDINAAELFKFLAYLSPQDIRYELIRAGAGDGPVWFNTVAATKIQYNDAMSKLQKYGLIELVHGTHHQVHPCLHDWAIHCLNSTLSGENFLTALNCISRSVPEDDNAKCWQISFRLLEHILHLRQLPCLSSLWEKYETSEIVLEAHIAFGRILSDSTHLEMAVEELTQALSRCSPATGEPHASVPVILLTLGRVHQRQGRFIEAMDLLRNTLSTYKDLPGADKHAIHSMILEVGVVARDIDKLPEAESIFKKALADFERELGSRDILTLSARSYLGQLYSQTGHFPEAEVMLQAAHYGLHKILAADHPLLLQNLAYLAMLWSQTRTFDEAEALFLHVLGISEKFLDVDHRTTLVTLEGLGELYQQAGKLEDAESKLLRAFQGYARTHGLYDIRTLIAMRKLGVVYTLGSNVEKGEKFMCVTLYELGQKLGEDHAWTMDAVESLAQFYVHQKKFDQAEVMFERILSNCNSMGAISRGQEVAADFARLLAQNIETHPEGSDVVFQWLARLIRLVDEWDYVRTNLSPDPSVLYGLGRAFIHIRDQQNARIALSHYLKRAHDSLLTDSWICDACGNKFFTMCDFHICLVCDRYLFCSNCMTEFPHAAWKAKSCSKHDLHETDLAEVWEAGSPGARDVPELHAWLEDLMRRFPWENKVRLEA